MHTRRARVLSPDWLRSSTVMTLSLRQLCSSRRLTPERWERSAKMTHCVEVCVGTARSRRCGRPVLRHRQPTDRHARDNIAAVPAASHRLRLPAASDGSARTSLETCARSFVAAVRRASGAAAEMRQSRARVVCCVDASSRRRRIGRNNATFNRGIFLGCRKTMSSSLDSRGAAASP